MRYFLISILPCHSSPAPAAERGPPISTTTHKVGILPQRFVPRPGAARGKVPCYLRLRFQTQPSVAETHVSVRLLPGFKRCVYTVSGSMVPGPPFPRSDGSALRLMQSAAVELDLVFSGQAGTGCFRYSAVLTSSSIFSLAPLTAGSASMLGTRCRVCTAVCPRSVTPLPGRPGGGGSPGRGPTRGPFSCLLTGRQRCTRVQSTLAKEASWHSGCPGEPG